jgi:hypothetical protein
MRVPQSIHDRATGLRWAVALTVAVWLVLFWAFV